MQPVWVARLVSRLLGYPDLDVFLITVSATDAATARTGGGLAAFLYAAFERYDRRRVEGADPGSRTDLRQIVRPDRVLDGPDGQDRFVAGLFLAVGVPDEALRARFDSGLLTVRSDRGDALRPATREVLAGAPVLQYSLLLWRDDAADPAVILTSYLRTNRLSVAATAAHFHAHLTHLLATRLAGMAHGSSCAAGASRPARSADGPPLPEAGGIVRLTGSLSRMASLRIESALRARRQQEDWALAAVRVDDPQSPLHFDPRVRPPSILLPPPGTIWADPFPVRRDGRTWIFFEEMERSTRRGHISIMELTEELQPGVTGSVLSAPYHLSYPFAFEWRGELFMLPETEENRTVELHRCVSWPDQWTLEAVLLDRVSAADATLVEAFGRWWLFTTMNPGRDADWDTDLYLFHADAPLGPWTPHVCNPVKSDVRNTRSAGRLFWQDGRLYRPAQDCAERYGHALVVNEITRLDTECFEEREAWRVHGWRSDIVGVHTMNREHDVLLLDCRIRRRKQ